jgi:hypothetical protein
VNPCTLLPRNFAKSLFWQAKFPNHSGIASNLSGLFSKTTNSKASVASVHTSASIFF